MALARLKALLRNVAERTGDGLWTAISQIVDVSEPEDCANQCTAAGYDPD